MTTTELEEIRQNLRKSSLHREFQTKSKNELSPVNNDRVINVMQWNILAQGLSNPDRNFVRVNKDVINYEKRKWHILEQILVHKPDLCSLEEMDIYESFLKEELLKYNYCSYFTPKTTSPTANFKDDSDNFKGPDGVLLIYKKEIFKEIASHSFELPNNGRQGKQMVACLELEHIPSQTFIVLLGTHLKSKQPFAKDRSEQTNVICQFINEHYSKHSHILLLGDFNGEPIEPFYNQILSTGLLSAYNTLLDHEPEFTTFKFRPGYNENDEKESCHTIDYIFYNPQGFHPLSYLSIPSKTEIGVNGLPSYEYPSDHLALATKFLII